MYGRLIGLFAGLVAAAAVGSAHATIIGGTVTGGSASTDGGTFIKLSVPFAESTPDNTVGDDTFETPNLYGFDEDQNILLGAPLSVDTPAGQLATGTTVASHYIFFDPGPTQRLIGTVTFDAPVLAIIFSTNNLDDSDFLADTGVTYLNPGLRGLERGDVVTISDTFEISIDFTASTPGDYIRVLTAFSPGAATEPGTLAVLAAGLLGLGFFMRRRRR